ncbi:glycosyltransferase [Rahnella aquatilis]|uniref:Glycosyl transferase n=1 Tax=Rahnella aquatilis (strain ATCC 33071 / DSM 4594 / JCM 1683 / NBRC 105701 / NCIMB 13365 / CIP 78.65) TaxID=745277 RepID=H2IY79_RAHAC|nr:glycosyltransferase [Rahnella aquatilis]AEX54205.1 glycosyl transferase [Rahnella aquatilis CIP 78.65 = ATCC 33071]KFD00510.1 glycosyltransferase [Rahnella aquatilis CIP 78.65 = ATCC 33071]
MPLTTTSGNIKLSAIIPLYNAGEMFRNFMDSLVAQTLENLEIIIVNDGSTDGSERVAQEYAEKYPHIRVIHQANGGVSRARNAGLDVAKGQYVTFPDADDILYPDMYQTLIELCEQDDLDAAQCNGERYFVGSEKVKPIIPTDRLTSTAVLDGPHWLKMALATNRYLHVVWLGVYRLELIKKHNLYFEPGLHHQDIPWTTEFMFNARRVKYTQKILYRYYIHGQSISNQKRTGMKNVEYQRHYLKIAKMLDELNKRYKDQVKIYAEFPRQVTREALTVCHSVRREPEQAAQKAMIDDIYTSGTRRIMLRNARGPKQWWQLLLWLYRLHNLRKKLG